MKLNAKELEALFHKIHNHQYIYPEITDTRTRSYIEIKCKNHPDLAPFVMRIDKHKAGQGCPECNNRPALNNQRIIEQFEKVHGMFYDYSEVDYRNATTKVIVICPLHGRKEITPSDHKRGRGCNECNGNNPITGIVNTMHPDPNIDPTYHAWLVLFRRIHNNKYTYPNEPFLSLNDKNFKAICSVHGPFSVTPRAHRYGSGCKKCESKSRKAKLAVYTRSQKAISKKSPVK